MIRDLGPFVPKRPRRLNGPLLTMLLNGVHDHAHGQVFVLQVGAGNGETGLPLLQRFRDDGWSGLLIEPMLPNFTLLETLHRNSERVAVLNLGISDLSANLSLHTVAPEAEARNRRIPRGRASLLRDRIAMPGVSGEDITSIEVPFLRMDTVLRELGIDSAQVVAVNAGGHEAEVLGSFDIAALNASLVLVHSAAATPSDTACITQLTEAGFLPFRLADWLIGLAPDRLTVPLEELLTFFQRGIGAPQDEDE